MGHVKEYDYLIVGAGLAGSVIAERLANARKKVIIVEKRDHIGGNCFDRLDQAGILVQQYGPHIFHTSNQYVWAYLSQFTEWLPYCHRVKANVDGKVLTLPINLTTIYELFNESTAKIIEEKIIKMYGEGNKIPVLELLRNNDADLKNFAQTVYRKIYLNYTKKQWGMDPRKLNSQVLNRVPIWINRDDRYFRDKYQGMPKYGYTKIFMKMLDQKNIKLILDKDYKEIISQFKYTKIIYTGPIDYFFNYKYGRLKYRSLRFEFKILNQDKFQDWAVVNYTGKEPFTRRTEFKHFYGQKSSKTTILREFPENYEENINIPCYPIPNAENVKLYQKYKNEVNKLEDVIFVGRLAEYRYYNMDEVVEKALNVFKSIVIT